MNGCKCYDRGSGRYVRESGAKRLEFRVGSGLVRIVTDRKRV